MTTLIYSEIYIIPEERELFNHEIALYFDPELFENYIQDVIGILQAEGL